MGSGDYKWDVFLSYSFNNVVKRWVAERFLNFFKMFLSEELAPYLPENGEPKVYLAANQIQGGDVLKEALREDLLHSKVLVAICSPVYFKSSWCLSEWESFRLREEAIPFRGLRIPVLFNDGEHYERQFLDDITYVDFRDVIYFTEGGEKDPISLRFQQRVEALAKAVASAVLNAPRFDPAWPVKVEKGGGTPNTSLPRM